LMSNKLKYQQLETKNQNQILRDFKMYFPIVSS
jgi:hypothetical protein